MAAVKAADTPFGQELEVFRKEQETAQQYFFAYLAIRAAAAGDEKVLAFLNTNPMFWVTTHHALLLAAFVALGRVFDQNSRHNLDRVMKAATDDLSLFSRAVLAQRKEEEGLTRAQAAVYVSDAYEATAADFRSLRKEIAERRRAYEARYRDVRDKIFAHNEISDTSDANALLAKTNIEEMKGIFGFLHALNDAMWELLYNGRKPDLSIQDFVLPPADPAQGRSMKPGEKIAREARAFLDAARG